MTYQEWLGFMQQYLQSVEKYSSIYSGQQIDTAVGKALNPDTTPTANSSALVTSGGVKSAIINQNLLDNAYFVGGGSQQGGGQFPINQRGLTSYSGTGYKIDRWLSQAEGTLEITSDGVNFGKVISPYNYNLTSQTIEADMSAYVGREFTLSFLTPTGLYTGTGMLSTSYVYAATGTSYMRFFYSSVTNSIIVEIVSLTDFLVQAAKLELGDTQTLAHKENGVLVLNEIPNYQQELAKCQRYFQTFRTQSLRPTYGVDFRPVMATATPTLGTLTIDGITYYTASSDL